MPTRLRIHREPQQRRSRELHERIVATTFMLMEVEPQGALTMRDVASACGVSVGAVTGRFATRHDLLVAVQDEYWRRSFDALPEMVEKVRAAPDRVSVVREAVVQYMGWVRTHEGFVTAMKRACVEDEDLAARQVAYNAELLERVFAFARTLSRTQLGADDTLLRLAMRMVVSFTRGGTFPSLDPTPLKVDPDVVAASVAEVIAGWVGREG